MDLSNVSKRKLIKELTNMTSLMFRIAGELYLVNPKSRIFKDDTFDRDNLHKIANVATFMMRKAKSAAPEIHLNAKPKG